MKHMSFKTCVIIQQSIKKPTTNLRLNTAQAQRNKKGERLINQTVPLHKERDILEIN